FLDETVNQVLQHTQSVNYSLTDLPPEMSAAALKRLAALIDEHKSAIPPQAAGWGWKNPRSIFILPLIQSLYPDFHFVHVVRDGRDMALSVNQNQLRKYYADIFGKALRRFPDTQASIE